MVCDRNIPSLPLGDLCGSIEQNKKEVIKSVVIDENQGVIVNGRPFGRLIRQDGFVLKVIRFAPDNPYLHGQICDFHVSPKETDIQLVIREI